VALELTTAAQQAAEKTNVQPQIVLKIEGIDYVFGAVPVEKLIRIGDSGLLIDGSWTIGGLAEHEDSKDIIDLSGTGTKISQQLMPDKGAVTSASSIKISLLDENDLVTEMISPGQIVDDVLGRRAQVYLGFQGTAWPEDFVEIFSGLIDDVDSGAGTVALNIVHPDRKKFQKVFFRKETTLSSGINNSVATLPVTDESVFDYQPTGPDGSFNLGCTNYVRIDDEVILYAGIGAGSLSGCTRGQLGTTAVAHDAGAKVETYFVLEDNCMDLALRLMLSGWNGNFVDGLSVLAIGPEVDPDPGVTTTDFITLPVGVNAVEDYGLREGDFAFLQGLDEPGDNAAWFEITGFGDLDGQSNRLVYVDWSLSKQASGLDDVYLGFRSQYDTLGQGLKMSPLEVDVEEHERWRDLILSSYEYRIYVKDTIDAKDFLEQEIYMPYGAYALPRKGKSSVGFHIGPLPQAEIVILSQDTVKNPSKIRMRRSTSRNFYNGVAYKFDESPIEDKFLSGIVTIDEDSRNRIPVGNAVFAIDSKGIRTDLLAESNIEQSTNRRLNRYKFGAEFFENIEVFFKTGFNVEPGDLVVFDFTNLRVSNTAAGDREKPAKFYEVINKSIDLKTGAINLSLVDTNYDASERYGLLSPSSRLGTGSDETTLVITPSYEEYFDDDEWRKWEDFEGLPIRVHSEDYSFDEVVTFLRVNPANKRQLLIDPSTPLSLPPPADYVVDIPDYSSSTDPNEDRLYKLLHAHFSPIVDVATGTNDAEFDVGVGDADKFFVGAKVIVHSEDFSDMSDELAVSDVTGTHITVNGGLGFTPDSTHKVSLIGFPDQDAPYRWI
jgi:hypothetical protein